MPAYRITKYDPAFRNESGSYARDEWTSVSDIGRSYRGSKFTLEEYRLMEDAYLLAVRAVMACAGVTDATVSGLEMSDRNRSKAYCQLPTLCEGQTVSDEALDWVVRLALREELWCRLSGDSGFYVHFGYDYYMYAGFTGPAPLAFAPPPGLFLEAHVSPCWPEESVQ
jgi:hypothetical protein